MSSTRVVHFEVRGDVALITLDNPPINALSAQVRAELLTAIQRLEADGELRAGVITGQGQMFVAGSDLREFGLPLQQPDLPAVIAAIERCSKPVIAALNGPALGGGLELALGCDGRVAAHTCVVGLPEVTLGIIPGAGGTQRLPRLVGVATAIELICAGTRLKADKAQALGIVDVLTQGDLQEEAVDVARRSRKRSLLHAPIPQEIQDRVPAAIEQALRKGRGRPAVHSAIEVILNAECLTVEHALTQEREVFQRLRVSAEAAALRHVFFAERGAGRIPELADVQALPVEQVAVIGAGIMGAGIAVAFLDAGFSVTLVELSEEALLAGRARIEAIYARQVRGSRVTQAQVDERLALLRPTRSFDDILGCQLVVEAVFEDMAVKLDLMARLDQVVGANTIIASNTSYLDLDRIAAASRHPENVCGLHFFSPANVMGLLEVVQGAQTSLQTMSTALAVGKRLGKTPVVAKNAFGFIGNRIYTAYRRQCEYLLEEGASPAQIDTAMEAFGFAMGPFAVADLSGLDIAWRMRKAGEATRDPRQRYVDIADRLCDAGRLGRKTGAGYYRYEGDQRRDDLFTGTLIAEARARKGVIAQTFTADDIQKRLLVSIVSEASLLLAEGVARLPSDIDLVLVHGYGYPRWEGGPLFWARQQNTLGLNAALHALAKVSPAVRIATLEEVLGAISERSLPVM